MKLKRTLAMLMALTLTAGAVACGNSEGSATPETKPAAADDGSEAADDSTAANDDAADADADAGEEDVAEIEVMFWTLNKIPADTDLVEEAINTITREKINTEVNLNIIEMGNYTQQLNLMISGGEKLDLMVTLPGDSAHFNSMSSQNQLTDLTDLLPEYAPELLETVPEAWLSGTTVNGRILSVTSFGDKATPLGFACRTDILEKTGIDPSTIKTADDFEELFAKVAEVEPGMTPVATGSMKILTAPYLIDADGNFVKYDGLGDGDNSLVGIMDGDGTTIQNNYLREEYMATSQRFLDWYNNGWVYKDGANYKETQEALISGGACFGLFKCFSTGAESSLSATCGFDMTIINVDPSPEINTGMLRKFSWAVPVTATEPEAAVKFMNLLYTDAEVLNLLTWGIEGTHYQTLEDGTIDFMDGEDANTSGYYLGDETAIFGNGFIAKVWKGNSPTLREDALATNMSAVVSPYTGFSFNSDGFENQVAALTQTIQEYRPSFACGLYTDDYYNEFIAKLESNGVNEYIAYIQEQFDAWLQENGGAEAPADDAAADTEAETTAE